MNPPTPFNSFAPFSASAFVFGACPVRHDAVDLHFQVNNTAACTATDVATSFPSRHERTKATGSSCPSGTILKTYPYRVMEVPIIHTWAHMHPPNVILKPTINTSSLAPELTTKRRERIMVDHQNMDIKIVNYSVHTNFPKDNNSFWNGSDVASLTNGTEMDYEYPLNSTVTSKSWALCTEWTPTQHNLFQTANFFFAAAFLVPGSFKQSVLLVRALLTIGYIFLTVWASVEVCALDLFLWNLLLVLLNSTHTFLLSWRFLPPALTLELTELYLKVFKPLRVSKKHFKELVKEAKVMTLEHGDIYAVEDVSPADERLSILLKGKMRVTCDDTHLHFINVHQFVDSPEWEANHEQSDDVFQVTITAEEDSVYLCWNRMKLERVLRHRPLLKTVFDSIIGKDITQKLYSLNEHLSGLDDERKRGRRDEIWAKAHTRSMSMDAVNTGPTGLVRSQAFKSNNRKQSVNSEVGYVSGHLQTQCWVPLVASQFPATSPFMQPKLDSPSSLRVQEVHSPQRTRSVKRPNREVKFQKLVK